MPFLIAVLIGIATTHLASPGLGVAAIVIAWPVGLLLRREARLAEAAERQRREQALFVERVRADEAIRQEMRQ